MTQIFESLGWALMHSLWQGTLALLAVLVFRAAAKTSAPSIRYSFQIVCLFACFAAFLVTFGLHLNGGEAPASLKAFSGGTAAAQTAVFLLAGAEGLQVSPQGLTISAAAYAPLLGALWCIGFVFMAARYLIAYFTAQQLRYKGLSDVPVVWQHKFRALVRSSGVTTSVRIFVSDYVSGPLTIGFIKPVVLVPAGLLMGLPRDQVEAILLHELAHIRRYDYLVNLFQTAIKTVLFFHPAIHYISRKIDIDREQACDDLAITHSRNPQALVRGLAALSMRVQGADFAMAATGGSTPLMDRLKRLVGPAEHRRRPEHLLMPLISTLLIGGIYLSSTLQASAHPEVQKYEHAETKDKNYKFETARINGKSVTVKVTDDNRRWVLAGGEWTDIDTSPDVLRRLPISLPQPPKPPVPPVYINGALDEDAFEAKMTQFEIDMEYFEADLDRYFDENNHMSEREEERLERYVERAAERVEREAERIQERAEAQAERAAEHIERAAEQQARAAEQVLRAKAHAKRAAKMQAKAEASHNKHKNAKAVLYDYLISDGLIASRAQNVTMRYSNKNWIANGVAIPSEKEGKYCNFFSNLGVKKSAISKIELKPNSFQITSDSNHGRTDHTHKVTIGRHIHRDGKVHDPAIPNPPAPPQAYPQETVVLSAQNHTHVASSNLHRHDKTRQYTPAFQRPTDSDHVTAKFGIKGGIWEFSHQGIDFKGDTGAPVFASSDGVVEYLANEKNWGKRITLKHPGGFQTLYGHMDSFAVKNGQTVKAGEQIGTVGSTGKSTEPHLHFELRKNGKPIDPAPFLK